MSFTYFLIVLAIAIAYIFFKRAGQVPRKVALAHLKSGAVIVDVRSKAEFQSGHLSQAVNLPLDNIEMLVSNVARSKEKVLLLHCQSGMRSGMAKRRLADVGYTNVHNLGSYARAQSIVSSKR